MSVFLEHTKVFLLLLLLYKITFCTQASVFKKSSIDAGVLSHEHVKENQHTVTVVCLCSTSVTKCK